MSACLRNTAVLIVLLLGGCATGPTVGLDGPSQSGSDEMRRIYLSVIRGLSDQGKSQAALAFLDDYDLRFPGDRKAKALRGKALLRAGQRDKAERIFAELLKDGYRPAADFGLGQARAAKGDWHAAVAHFDDAVRLAPTNVRYLNNFGYALLKTGDTARAHQVLARATELDPKDERVRNNYILATMRDGHAAEAEKALDRFDSKERDRIYAFVRKWSP